MVLDLSGRKALVTGGVNGIGRAISEALIRCGAQVYVADLAAERPVERAPEFGGIGLEADVTNLDSLAAAFAAAGPLDIVVANAGTATVASLEATTVEIWDRTLRVNLTGAFHTMRLAAEQMRPRRRGAIVLTASTNSYDGEPDLSAYNATKAGLLGLLHTAAGELGPYGIRVNAVCPGLIRTRLTADHFAQGALLKEYFRHIPLGSGGHPEEVANAVAFLASDLASFITGAALLIDGGQMATKFGTWNEASADFINDHWELK